MMKRYPSIRIKNMDNIKILDYDGYMSKLNDLDKLHIFDTIHDFKIDRDKKNNTEQITKTQFWLPIFIYHNSLENLSQSVRSLVFFDRIPKKKNTKRFLHVEFRRKIRGQSSRIFYIGLKSVV